MDSSRVIPFPLPNRQKGTAIITSISDNLPSSCQLVHNKHSLSIDGVIEMQHQWQQGEMINVIYHKDRAIVIGCKAEPDNRFNLDIQYTNSIINLVFGEDLSGNKSQLCRFLGNESDITLSTYSGRSGYYFDIYTLDNNGIWCLLLLGFNINI